MFPHQHNPHPPTHSARQWPTSDYNISWCHIIYTVEPHPPLTDTPEMQPPMIMRTLRLVQNAISIDLHTIRTPQMWTPCYSVKRTLGLAPIVSPSIQTHRYSGHFGNKFVDSLVKKKNYRLARVLQAN